MNGLLLGTWCVLAFAFAFVVSWDVRVANAADRDPASTRVANDLYKTGLDRVKDGQWEAARDAFARAYELDPSSSKLANLAAAEVHVGKLVEGVEHYRLLLKEPKGMTSDDVALVTRAMKDAEARIAHVRIVVTNSTSSDQVELDGNVLARAALDVDYPINPGKHLLVASRGTGWETARLEIDLREAESRTAKLSPRRIDEPRKQEKGLLSSPWFWIVSGVVVVGATTTVVCLAAVCRDERAPYSGNLGRVNLP